MTVFLEGGGSLYLLRICLLLFSFFSRQKQFGFKMKAFLKHELAETICQRLCSQKRQTTHNGSVMKNPIPYSVYIVWIAKYLW